MLQLSVILKLEFSIQQLLMKIQSQWRRQPRYANFFDFLLHNFVRIISNEFADFLIFLFSFVSTYLFQANRLKLLTRKPGNALSLMKLKTKTTTTTQAPEEVPEVEETPEEEEEHTTTTRKTRPVKVFILFILVHFVGFCFL